MNAHNPLGLPQVDRPTALSQDEITGQQARQQFLYQQALGLLQASRVLLIQTMMCRDELSVEVRQQLHNDALSIASVTQEKL